MARQVTNYGEDFKRSSAALAVESEKPLREVAKSLGVHGATLHGWVKRYYPEAPTTCEQKQAVNGEIKKLRQENQRLRQERDILKKAAAYFAKNLS